MIFLLSLIFIGCCIAVFIRILKEFQTGFDWFSASLYLIIFLVSCGLIYITIFGLYYLAKGGLI